MRANLLRLGILFALLMTMIVSALLVGYSRNFDVVQEQYHTKKKSFKWLEEVDVEQPKCRNTVQGQMYITDDRGFVCKRKDLDVQSGCCKADASNVVLPEEAFINDGILRGSHKDGSKKILESSAASSSDSRFLCMGCSMEHKCCQHYETCVSCCLGQDKKPHLESILAKEYPFLSRARDQFELCTALCRTSSKNLVHEREYLNEQYKYCYTDEIFGPPPCIGKCAENEKDLEKEKAQEGGDLDMELIDEFDLPGR